MDVVIVGNSDSVLEHHLGWLIDQMYVVRCNRAPISGYEDFVGTKQNERWVNPEIANGEEHEGLTLLPYEDIRGVVVSHDQFNKAIWGLYQAGACTVQKSPDMWAANLKAQGIKVNATHNPTTGFEAICDWIGQPETPYIHGFDLDSDRIFHHYWRKEKRNSTFHKHDYEKGVIRQLLDMGKIKLLTDHPKIMDKTIPERNKHNNRSEADKLKTIEERFPKSLPQWAEGQQDERGLWKQVFWQTVEKVGVEKAAKQATTAVIQYRSTFT